MPDIPDCYTQSMVFSSDQKLEARESIFGWVVRGNFHRTSNSPFAMKATATEVQADVILQQLWDMEEVHDKTTPFTDDENRALDRFQESTKKLSDGRYSVSLPRCIPTPVLGESRGTALKRFFANKRSLTRKDSWASFSAAVNEYDEMGHAERVPDDELQKPCKDCYYLPCME